MKIAFVVCEYDPLHDGHILHLRRARRETGADALVCLMSGDLVQRGALAVRDKFSRAEWALRAGADLVAEIPAAYCLGSGEIFAAGAVKYLNYLVPAVESVLSFGSECGDVALLRRLAAAKARESEAFRATLRAGLARGENYAAAYLRAARECLGEDAAALERPNNLLGVEYLCAAAKYAPTVGFHTIKRAGSHRGGSAESPCASDVRRALRENKPPTAVPAYVAQALGTVDCNARDDRLLAVIKYALADGKALAACPAIKEGLENRIAAVLPHARTLDEFYELLATRRYSKPTLRRAVLSALCGVTETAAELLNKSHEFINILAVRADSRALLKIFTLPVATKPSERKKQGLSDPVGDRAQALYSAVAYPYESYMRIAP